MVRGLLRVHAVTIETHEMGLMLAERYRLSIYDAMIVAAALDAGCDRLWSEDMQNGMVIERSLRIVDPLMGIR
jgi:predicted nucleic acid-binding protein